MCLKTMTPGGARASTPPGGNGRGVGIPGGSCCMSYRFVRCIRFSRSTLTCPWCRRCGEFALPEYTHTQAELELSTIRREIHAEFRHINRNNPHLLVAIMTNSKISGFTHMTCDDRVAPLKIREPYRWWREKANEFGLQTNQ